MAAGEIIERHFKSFNDHDGKSWAAHYTNNVVIRDPQYAEPLQGRDAVQKDIENFFAAFPDIQFSVTNRIASGDQIVVEGVATGTHRGSMETPNGTLKATNKQAKIAFALFMQVDDSGHIAAERRYYDLAGMMQQLGLMSQ